MSASCICVVAVVDCVENVIGLGNCVFTEDECATLVFSARPFVASALGCAENVNGLGNCVSTDEDVSCAGAIEEEVVLRYLRTGPARLHCTHSAARAKVRNEGIVICAVAWS